MSFVSIIIPCYNAEKYVAEAIQSALDQTYPHCEVIVIDDGSTDGSLEVIKCFGDKIRWETGPNRGGCAARNRGLELAQGEWIQFLDADDLISAEKIERQMELARLHRPNVLISCQWKRFREDIAETGYPIESIHMPQSPVAWLIQKYSGNGMMPLHAWLSSKCLVDQTNAWDTELIRDQDGEFFDHIATLSQKIVHVPETMAFYRSALGGSVSGNTSEAAVRSCLISMERGSARLVALQDSPEVRQACAWSLLRITYEAYPRFPELSRRAGRLAAVYGGSRTRVPVSGGRLVKGVRRFLGWKLARRCQDLIQALKYGARFRA